MESAESPLPLATIISGRAVKASLQELFDSTFKEVGPGSFEEAYRIRRDAQLEAGLSSPEPWKPSPPASPLLAGLHGEPRPTRTVNLTRPVKLPPWGQVLLNLPSRVSCEELWCLYGLERGNGFIVEIETQMTGAPLTNYFTMRCRYKATALSESVTQLDAEIGLEWKQAVSDLQHKVDEAIMDEFRQSFENHFLPLLGFELSHRLAKGNIVMGLSFTDTAAQSLEAIGNGHLEVGATFQMEQTPSVNGTPSYSSTAGAGAPPQASFQLQYDASQCRGSDAQPRPAAPLDNGLLSEYDEDWNAGVLTNLGGSVILAEDGSGFELRVEVLSASDLIAPEYRVGDLSARLLSGFKARLGAVYVEIFLLGEEDEVASQTGASVASLSPGGRVIRRTSCAENPNGDRNVTFTHEKCIFDYGGEAYLRFQVKDRRGIQAAIRGDPLVGEGALPLTPTLKDCIPRWADVPLSRGGVAAGTLSVRYQIATIPGLPGQVQQPRVPSSSSTPAQRSPSRPEVFPISTFQVMPQSAAAAARTGEDEEDFLTPPGTHEALK